MSANQTSTATLNSKQITQLLAWSEEHRSCAICWWPSTDYRRNMEVHHIVGGNVRSKSHEVWNYLKLCDRCHMVYHSGKVAANVPDLHLGHMLNAKRESDSENYFPDKLAALKNRLALPKDPEPIPEFYLRERERNVLHYKDRTP